MIFLSEKDSVVRVVNDLCQVDQKYHYKILQLDLNLAAAPETYRIAFTSMIDGKIRMYVLDYVSGVYTITEV
jgi:hypothetical protein